MSSLRELRKLKGLTQIELAAQLGITQSALSKLETGVRRPTEDTYDRLYVMFGEELAETIAAPVHRKYPEGSAGRQLQLLIEQAVGYSGMTMRELSLDMGYSQSALSQVKSGVARRISDEMALLIEARLGKGWAERLVIASALAELERVRAKMAL